MNRLVLNGFFRSGTSILWRAVALANPQERVLYEPCHPDLLSHVRDAQAATVAHPVHGFALWSGYGRGLAALSAVRAGYRGSGAIFCGAEDGAAEYAERLFSGFGARLLQVNRWHHVLGQVEARTGARLVHVLRDPRDVHASFARIFRSRRGLVVADVLRRAAPGYLPPLSWGMLRALREHEGAVPRQLRALRRARPLLSRQGFDVTFAVWLLANAAAVRATLAAGGQAFWIEEIVRDPAAFAAAMAETGLDCDTSVLSAERVGTPPAGDHGAPLAARADALGLGSEWAEIAATLLPGATFRSRRVAREGTVSPAQP